MNDTPSLAPPAPSGSEGPFLPVRNNARLLCLSALGGALEFYDFVVFAYFVKLLSEVFFPAHTPPWLAQLRLFGIFATGYLVRPLGGLWMAHYGDRLGRKRMFRLSVLLMALPTLGIGLLPGYAQLGLVAPLLLLVLRLLQGIAIGGEIPGAWVFVAEHAPPSRRGFALSCLTCGMSAGLLLGSLLAAWMNRYFDATQLHAWAWRIPFLFGGTLGFLGVWMRSWLRETPVFEAMQAARQLSETLPLGQVLRRHRRGVLVSMLATWLLTAAILVVILMTPTLVQQRFHMSAARAFAGSSWATLCLTFGTLLSGLAVDRLGCRRVFIAMSLLLALTVYALYFDLACGGAHFLGLYALAGFAVGAVGVVPSLLVAAFPPAVRYSGIALAYNLAYALFGALTPPLIGYMSGAWGALAPAHYVALVALIAGFTGAIMLRRDGTYQPSSSASSRPQASS